MSKLEMGRLVVSRAESYNADIVDPFPVKSQGQSNEVLDHLPNNCMGRRISLDLNNIGDVSTNSQDIYETEYHRMFDVHEINGTGEGLQEFFMLNEFQAYILMPAP